MKKIFVPLILSFISFYTKSAAQNNMQEDTLKISGTCESVRKTGNIIATSYFRFKVIDVLEGSYKEKYIEFESDINSKAQFLYSQIKKGKTTNKSQRACKCSSKPLVLTLVKRTDEYTLMESYHYLSSILKK